MEKKFEFYSEKLYELRKSKGMSQEEFAEKVGVSRQSIYAWESGKSLPDMENIYKMCQILGIPTSELTNFGAEQKNNRKKLKVKKMIIILISIIITIYLIIAFRYFYILSSLNKKYSSIIDYDNYSYSHTKYKLKNDECEYLIHEEVYYKDGILKIVHNSSSPSNPEHKQVCWYNFNTNEEYIFSDIENQKTLRKSDLDENISKEIIYAPNSISGISNNGLVQKDNFKNFLGSIFWPFCAKIYSLDNCYQLKVNVKDGFIKSKISYSIDKKNGFPSIYEEYKSDGSHIFDIYEFIKVKETTDDDIKIPNLEEYIIIE